MIELLTPLQMTEADRLSGSLVGGSYRLMENAGAQVARLILARYPGVGGADVLCGPGNNGGDGYVVARLLAEDGWSVRLYRAGVPKAGTDAAEAASRFSLSCDPVTEWRPSSDRLVVDALFGAGLRGGLDRDLAEISERAGRSGAPVVAIDLPSGVDGSSGAIRTRAFHADLTVTFARPKPGHYLQPGRAKCGELVVADIGIDADVIAKAVANDPPLWINAPQLWQDKLPKPSIDAHKYARGHVGVFCGGATSTGAARLSAMAAARAGAGAVTVLSPGSALLVNASHLTSIMLKRVDNANELDVALTQRRLDAAVIGPGFGDAEKARAFVAQLSARHGPEDSHEALVLDADALTAFEESPPALFGCLRKAPDPFAVLTPHQGEFRRLFPDVAMRDDISKVERARAAAARANAVVVLKGPDTVIAHPDGRAAVNVNGSPWLATAGSGDVLAGIAAALIAQRMPLFEAGCAAVWMHARAGEMLGPGSIAEDLPSQLPDVLREFLRSTC
jgi:ADP-dependent NAD(P)H-hydrate dehydratase / NAD(P)H-hydrate epimerase